MECRLYGQRRYAVLLREYLLTTLFLQKFPIPVDGLIARGDYEHEFTLHQFTILPGGSAPKLKVTQFDKIKIG